MKKITINIILYFLLILLFDGDFFHHIYCLYVKKLFILWIY
ncbi:hypothetical protein B4110_1645 [Parageobacillus toebii]|uniref:Uncharacterized protein n=1 Tax=Parageobacillus toebii TaxID=153151 RepID=A0A150MWS3_9BACL|nr:hypothetical protein B4110_1645 [Parageobacillus toebii]